MTTAPALTVYSASNADLERTDFGYEYSDSLDLDLAHESLSVVETHRDSDTRTPAGFHGHIVSFPVKKAQAADYESLLAEVTSHAETLVELYRSEWDGHNFVAGSADRDETDRLMVVIEGLVEGFNSAHEYPDEDWAMQIAEAKAAKDQQRIIEAVEAIELPDGFTVRADTDGEWFVDIDLFCEPADELSNFNFEHDYGVENVLEKVAQEIDAILGGLAPEASI